MTLCFNLYALFTIDSDARSFSTSGAIDPSDLDLLPDAILDVMGHLRPHAVKLVDSWQIPEYVLNSSLGRGDGKVYEDLFHRAHRLNPLNDITFDPYWENAETIHKSNGENWKL
jgi:acyl-CoA oxidase